MKTNFHNLLFEKNRMLEHFIFQYNVFIGKNRLCEELTKILIMRVNELMQHFKQGKNKLHYLLAILYLASIFI